MARAAAVSCRCSSVVFVGNIPYQVSEEELRAACEEIGPVVSLRVATDRDTGRPRGFAFCEYLDDETARSACRNLHGHPLRGRVLRVGIARLADGRARRDDDDDPRRPVVVEDATHAATLLSGAQPRDAITRYLAGMSRQQLRELLDAVEAQDEEVVERAKREFYGLATLIEQARILLDMAAPDKRQPGGFSPPEAPKQRRKLDAAGTRNEYMSLGRLVRSSRPSGPAQFGLFSSG